MQSAHLSGTQHIAANCSSGLAPAVCPHAALSQMQHARLLKPLEAIVRRPAQLHGVNRVLPWQRGDLAQVHRRLRSLEGRLEEHSAAFARGVAERVACELQTGGALSSHFWSRLMGRIRDANSELASRVYDLEGTQQSCHDLIQVCCWSLTCVRVCFSHTLVRAGP